MTTRRSRSQPRDVRGRYARRRPGLPPWWFIVLVLAAVFSAAYLF